MMNKRTAERTVTALFTCLIEDMRMTKGRTAGVRPVVEEDVGVRQKLRAGNKV